MIYLSNCLLLICADTRSSGENPVVMSQLLMPPVKLLHRWMTNFRGATKIIFIRKLQLSIKSEAALGGQTMFKKYVDLCRFVDFFPLANDGAKLFH